MGCPGALQDNGTQWSPLIALILCIGRLAAFEYLWLKPAPAILWAIASAACVAAYAVGATLGRRRQFPAIWFVAVGAVLVETSVLLTVGSSLVVIVTQPLAIIGAVGLLVYWVNRRGGQREAIMVVAGGIGAVTGAEAWLFYPMTEDGPPLLFWGILLALGVGVPTLVWGVAAAARRSAPRHSGTRSTKHRHH